MPVERSGKIGFLIRQYSQSDCNLLYSRSGVLGGCFIHETLGQATSERDIVAPGFDCAAVVQRKLDTVLMVSARITVLNPNDKIPCNSTSRRISRDVTSTSETWQVMPMTNEKYAKSR
jgi:hypothetical protein